LRVSQSKYTLSAVESRTDEFLRQVMAKAGFELKFKICEGETRHPDFENPDVVVKFSGPDVELLLSNKAELLLALELLTMEMLKMAPEDHSRLCFDADDYRMLRIEELRLSALAAAERVKRSGIPFRFKPHEQPGTPHPAPRAAGPKTAVRSESAGLGPQRQVAIYPANMPSSGIPASEPARAPMGRGRRR